MLISAFRHSYFWEDFSIRWTFDLSPGVDTVLGDTTVLVIRISF